MQAPAAAKPAVGVVFDSAMGENIGEALALALLYGLDGKQECRVVGMAVSKSNLESVGFCEAMARFYAGAVSGAYASTGRTLPIGMSEKGILPALTPMLAKTLSTQDDSGGPVYEHGIKTRTDTADPVAVLRNALTGQHDENAVVVITGPATNWAGVLALPGATDLIARKVRVLAVAEGSLEADVLAAKRLFAEWPTPVVFAGRELGQTLRYPGSSIENDFAWTPHHPLVDAYRASGSMPYDAPAHAMAAALHAVRTDKNYFQLSGPGSIGIDESGKVKFVPGSGNHRRLTVDPAQKDAVIQAFIELASAKPVPRPSRRPPPKEKVEPPKPPAAKP